MPEQCLKQLQQEKSKDDILNLWQKWNSGKYIPALKLFFKDSVEVQELTNEAKSLVYENYTKIIAADDTIAKVSYSKYPW